MSKTLDRERQFDDQQRKQTRSRWLPQPESAVAVEAPPIEQPPAAEQIPAPAAAAPETDNARIFAENIEPLPTEPPQRRTRLYFLVLLLALVAVFAFQPQLQQQLEREL